MESRRENWERTDEMNKLTNSDILQNFISATIKKYTMIEPNIYYAWVVLYIIGDRLRADELLKIYSYQIKQTATHNIMLHGLKKETIYRGFLLEPSDVDELDLWKYNHNSFTTNKDVAIAFSTNDSDYGIVFPDHFVGKICEIELDPREHFVWFDYRWNLPEDIRLFVDFWNQQEVIVGKLEDVLGNVQ